MNSHQTKNKTVNFFFILAIVICTIAIIASLIGFLYTYCKLTSEINDINVIITKDFNAIINELSKNNNSSELLKDIDLTNDKISSTINQLQKLHEIEISAVSHNILTFLYTFLSSVLIGIGTYYVNQCVKYTTDIKESHEQISKNEEAVIELKNTIQAQNVKTLDLSFYNYYQPLISLIDNISDTLNSTMPTNKKRQILCKYIPRLNANIQTLYTFSNNINDEDLQELKKENGKKISFDLNIAKERIDSFPTNISYLITTISKKMLTDKLESLKHLFEPECI